MSDPVMTFIASFAPSQPDVLQTDTVTRCPWLAESAARAKRRWLHTQWFGDWLSFLRLSLPFHPLRSPCRLLPMSSLCVTAVSRSCAAILPKSNSPTMKLFIDPFIHSFISVLACSTQAAWPTTAIGKATERVQTLLLVSQPR
eukprot:GHVU01032237.1.p1 GENE.GHVU01032237.1~~GHVU01032237.1.p1  ORF type:complete len:143 (-),score=0.35 GHVU01032237.1:203-631(-)